MREQTPKRYDLITNYRCGSSIEEMELADDGEWVRWESVEAELSALRAEQTRLREALESVAQGLRSDSLNIQADDVGLMTSLGYAEALMEIAERISAALSSTPTPETTP